MKSENLLIEKFINYIDLYSENFMIVYVFTTPAPRGSIGKFPDTKECILSHHLHPLNKLISNNNVKVITFDELNIKMTTKIARFAHIFDTFYP